MLKLIRGLSALAVAVALVTIALPASAQISDQLSGYGEENAKGYLLPLSDALAATLGDGWYYTAYIPKDGFRFSIEVVGMGMFYDDADRTFSAQTESGFFPQSTVDAPTIIGDPTPVVVNGISNTSHAFSGGLDLE